MSMFRKLFNTASLLLLVAYATLAIDGKQIEDLALWSSIVMTLSGFLVINTYDGPPVSELRATLLGRPPIFSRIMTFVYICIAAVMIFKALGLGQYLR
jgi:hypothetical protein